MGLSIETFSNITGGQSFFKAVGHPLAARQMKALVGEMRAAGDFAVYDPGGQTAALGELYPELADPAPSAVYVQSIDALEGTVLGRRVQPITDIGSETAKTLFVAAYDSQRLCDHIRHLLPDGMSIRSLDDIRLPEAMLSKPERYLDPLNFATNFAFFRDQQNWHTRLVTANYWYGYGARGVRYWACLIDAEGRTLAEWEETLPDRPAALVIDSSEIRRRFGLDDFVAQLFIHVIGVAGHDVVKYALDTYGDRATDLSCTHDANAWPADLYGGLPAPKPDEKVVLWIQNSHPRPIPPGEVGLNRMGEDTAAWLEKEIPPFGSYPLDVAELLPDARYPEQLEIRAGKYFVRPRYEVRGSNGRLRIAHANVERTDLKPDPRIPEIGNLMGKGYLVPAPVLPPGRYRSAFLPTPMATEQRELPVAVSVYDPQGKEIARQRLGRIARRDNSWLEIGELLQSSGASLDGFGHMEVMYDFADGGEADGWLHSIFRYEDRQSGHAAETSFGAHIFNTPLTYGNEPQSYAGPPPGLSTRLFLRVGEAPFETFCHLIYTTATQWHPGSNTDLILHSGAGEEISRRRIEIPMNGSLLWRVGDMFDPDERSAAGRGAYVIVRDTTCRLFGYHGLLNGDDAFSLDHMFGF